MSNDLIPDRTNGGANTVFATWYNLLRTVISGDLYPRDASCAPGNEVASLGTAATRWKRLFEGSGGFTAGAIKWRMSYNGLVLPSEGWMLMDGRQITQENYDAEHGDGHWDSYIIASPLDSKFLPNMVNRYLQGAASVAQDGSVAITPVGNAGSVLDLAHVHNWYVDNGAATSAETYDSSGNPTSLALPGSGTKTTGLYSLIKGSATQVHGGQTCYSASGLSAAQDIRPESFPVLFYMRII